MTPRTFWRLAFTASQEEAFAGARTSGRWHGRTSRPVYAASAISLAALERLVYLRLDPATGMFPVQHLYRVEIPARVAVEVLDPATLPARWTALAAPLDAAAAPTPLQALGDAWWQSRRAVAWVVPSALVPEEPNVLLHPEHPDWRKLDIAPVRPFRYDTRLAGYRKQ